MKKNILFFIVYLLFTSSYSQNFEKFLGGSGPDSMTSIEQTSDGGYICAGQSASKNGDLSGTECNADENGKTWIVKLSQAGNIQWQKCLETISTVYSIKQTSDGGYVVGGTAADMTGNHGGSDFYIAKLDNIGNIQWQKSLGGSGEEWAFSIQQTSYGGYIMAGISDSNDGDVTGNHGGGDYWIVKLSDTGNIQWQKSLGGTGYEIARSIIQTKDGGYIVAGGSNSNDGDVIGNHGGGGDYWIVKLNKRGKIQWKKSLGGSGSDYAFSIQQTTRGGYIITGVSGSNDGDVNGNNGGNDMWIVKITNSGNIQWEKCLGSSNHETGLVIRQTADDDYLVAGYTVPRLNDEGDPLFDLLMVKLSKSGIVQQEQTYGTPDGSDYPFSMEVTADGGYIIAGFSNSSYENGNGTHGHVDGWILKLGAIEGRLSTTKLFSKKSISDNSIIIYPNPSSNEIQVNTIEKIRDLPYTVYDQSGKAVLKGKLNENQTTITIGSLSKGIYILSIGDNNEINRKIIKD
ncbi:hypothetical protein FEDK69T_04930 [Flavobacterium enshiense DK69]|uniref:T9SS type A sorting domain-containing protein n=1 Tax=Flavobacterium enshiense TaxID=1341165 RepID=UPI0003C5B6F8|nr:T9SS type A sorting domain-containing protein [Flavobacterium enshiense]ESU24936.1 hypothetical protein FEDK69T_04930 [Flavobacterium enshiense DK69]